MHPKAFGRTKDLVCKLYIQSVSISWHFSNVHCTLFFIAHCTLMFKDEFLFLFTALLVNECISRIRMGVGAWSHACGRSQVICMNITIT